MAKKQTQPSQTQERPPIVAVLGHVDHGKSTLLDYIRKENTVEDEAGGITQHVAAYEALHTTQEGAQKRITFLDTPGHAAFKAIRARGATIADVAILVVAADDGVKEQTIEALASIRASGTPFIVAINKIDKPDANVERAKMSLVENEIYIEGMGGDVSWAAVSAKTGEGVSELLDLIVLAAELEEFTGDPSKPATGYVIESHRDPKRGVAATLIVTDGTMHAGEAVLAGESVAPLRIMLDQNKGDITEVSFSTPVTVIGFDDLPKVGSRFSVYPNKKGAEQARAQAQAGATQSTAVADAAISSDVYTIPVVVKADVAGSLEAVEHELQKLGDEYAFIRVVHKGIGTVSESDVKAACAAADNAVIVDFNVGVDGAAAELARQHDVSIESSSIIYELTENMEAMLKKRTPKREVEEVFGRARVLKHFSHKKDLQVVGGEVIEGEIKTGALVKILRRDLEVGSGEILNIQSGKQDVQHVSTGGQFGAEVESILEITPGDILECYTITRV